MATDGEETFAAGKSSTMLWQVDADFRGFEKEKHCLKESEKSTSETLTKIFVS